jgi:hypothetical protein
MSRHPRTLPLVILQKLERNPIHCLSQLGPFALAESTILLVLSFSMTRILAGLNVLRSLNYQRTYLPLLSHRLLKKAKPTLKIIILTNPLLQAPKQI